MSQKWYTQKNFKKTLDKPLTVWYNNYRKREREETTMMNRFQDTWFDVMFDEAIEELERESEEQDNV